MSYSQALEMQIHQAALWGSEYGLSRTVDGSAFRSFFPRAGQAQPFMENHLRYAETFFVAPPIASFIGCAASDIPDGLLVPETIPSRIGWLWFAAPMTVPGLQVFGDSTCITPNIRAISWATMDRERDGRTYFTVDGSVADGSVPYGITLLTYFDCTESSVPEFVSIDSWPFDERLSAVAPALESFDQIAPDDRERRIAYGETIAPFTRRLFYAFCSFIQQRILTSSAQRAERHTRKRLERDGWLHEPLIRVVELRRKQAQAEHYGDGEPVEWSHQWIVSGHWRQQWYPSLNTNQPRWIMPYVKGPPEKPLKPPRAKVFAVVR